MDIGMSGPENVSGCLDVIATGSIILCHAYIIPYHPQTNLRAPRVAGFSPASIPCSQTSDGTQPFFASKKGPRLDQSFVISFISLLVSVIQLTKPLKALKVNICFSQRLNGNTFFPSKKIVQKRCDQIGDFMIIATTNMTILIFIMRGYTTSSDNPISSCMGVS
jgi:hypothetical protein